MQINEDLIRNVVAQVLAEVGRVPASHNGHVARSYTGRYGVFEDANEAVAAARDAFEQLSRRTLAERKRIIEHIRRISIEQCVELGTMEMEETKIGRLEHKIEKLKTLGERSPGVEFLETRKEVYSGDYGLAVIEHGPFGVIGAITPVTHSLPTITGNAVSMIAAGNTVVVNPHPSGKRVAAEGVRRFNEAIYRDLGIDNRVVFAGRVPHDEIQHYYDLIDVLVYPRRPMRLTEIVTPLKPLEAMAQGRVLIASDVGGHRELIRDGETGYLFRAGDVYALAATIEAVLAQRSGWDVVRAKARRFVETERTWASSAARYVHVYRQLPSRGRTPLAV